MSSELRKDLRLVAISLGCAVVLLAIIMIAIAVVGSGGEADEQTNEAR